MECNDKRGVYMSACAYSVHERMRSFRVEKQRDDKHRTGHLQIDDDDRCINVSLTPELVARLDDRPVSRDIRLTAQRVVRLSTTERTGDAIHRECRGALTL